MLHAISEYSIIMMMRQGSQREGSKNRNRRRIIRARRPSRLNNNAVENSNVSFEHQSITITSSSPTNVVEYNYEEAVAAAEAIVYANKNNIEQQEIVETLDYSSETDSSSNGPTRVSECGDEESYAADYNSNPFHILMDDESSSSSEYTCGDQSKDRMHKLLLADDDDEKEGDEQDEVAKCAICFLANDPLHKWRRFIDLPCCGGCYEDESTTRFCAGCILQMALTRKDSVLSNEYSVDDEQRYEDPVAQFYTSSVGGKFIECPRCRDILRVNIEKTQYNGDDSDDDDSSGCDCSDCQANNRTTTDWTDPNAKIAKAITVQSPTFTERVQYAGKKVGLANILWRAAFLQNGFMPAGALGSDSNIHRLVNWGILNKISRGKSADEGGIFQMERNNHMALIKLLGVQNTCFAEEESGKNVLLMVELLAGMAGSAITQLCDWRVDRTMKIANRCCLLLLVFKGYLPPYPLSFWQEWVVTGLNIFVVALLLQFLFIVCVYLASLFGVALSVCYALRRSGDHDLRRHVAYSMAASSVFSLVIAWYWSSTYDLYNLCSLWITTMRWFWFVRWGIKALVAMKKIVWG